MTREEAIKLIRKYECNKDHYEACEMAIKALEQTRWIPVSKRLPEYGGYYFVTFQRNLLTRTERYTSISEFREGSWTEFGHVVAWMPLPEHYRAESKLDGDPIDIDKAIEHYEGTLETLKGIDLGDNA